MNEIAERSFTFQKKVSTVVEFGMSWSHLSAFGHTFLDKCHTSQRLSLLFLKIHRCPYDFNDFCSKNPKIQKSKNRSFFLFFVFFDFVIFVIFLLLICCVGCLKQKWMKSMRRPSLSKQKSSTVIDFGMSWSHLSAFGHTFLDKCHTSQRLGLLFLKMHRCPYDFNRFKNPKNKKNTNVLLCFVIVESVEQK